MEYIGIITSQFVAWLCALSFLGIRRWKGMLTGLCSGLLAAFVLLTLTVLGLKGTVSCLEALFLANGVTLFAFQTITSYSWRYASFAFLFAFGNSVLVTACEAYGTYPLLTIAVFMLLKGCFTPFKLQYPDWHEKENQEKDSFQWLPELLYGAVVVLSLIYNFISWKSWQELWFSILLMVGLFCGAELIILLYSYKCRTDAKASVDAGYRKEMETFLNVIRSQRHDYNFHVRTLAAVLKQGDLKTCQEYVQELIEDSNAMNEVLPVKDPAISATIYNFRVLAAREGITLHLDLENDLSFIVTNVYETNKIISNLLQNAIDEVKTHKDKKFGIWLYVLKRGQFCVIHTANELERQASPAFFENIYRSGYTTKEGHDGVGLSSISSLAARYRGVVYSRMENNIIHFVAKIPLKYEATDEDTYRREE